MSRSLLAFASFVASVAAHGHVTGVVVNGVLYPGWDIGSYPYMEDPPVVAAWGTPNTGNGPVDLTSNGYSNTDIICSLNATNAKGSITVAAGDKINLQWTEWPETHHGYVSYFSHIRAHKLTSPYSSDRLPRLVRRLLRNSRQNRARVLQDRRRWPGGWR